MSRLSVVMITQNVEDKVATALESANFANEIVIVDAGSQDKTLQICRHYTDKIYYNDWPGTTTKQWNEAIAKASGEWVLLLASDEQIGQDLKMKIQEIIASDTDCDGYFVCMKNIYLGKWLTNCGIYPDRTMRLFRRGKGKFQEREHGTVPIEGKTENLDAHIIHYSYRNIAEVMEKTERYTTLEAQRLVDEGFKLKKSFFVTKPWRVFKKAYFRNKGYRDGVQGLLFCLFAAYYRFVMLAKIWEIYNKDNIKNDIEKLIEENK